MVRNMTPVDAELIAAAKGLEVVGRIGVGLDNLDLPALSERGVVVCNPPYVAEDEADTLPGNVRDFEPHVALFAGPDGLDIIRRVIAGAADRLAARGHLLLEVGYDQASAVAALFRGSGWSEVLRYRDMGGHERVLHATRSAEIRTQVA